MFSREELESRISSSLKIIDQYRWLLDAYVLDFFVDDHWNKLPATWRESFENIDLSEIGDLVSGGKPKRILPLSALALLSNVKILSLSRTPSTADSDEKFENEPHKAENRHDDSDQFEKTLNCKDGSFNNLFLKRVKKKKRHEISLMSDLVYKTSKDVLCSNVVDIGSGLGHLARTLAYKYKAKTVGIEAQNELVNGAKKLDDQFNVTVSKYTKQTDILEKLKPEHINTMLTPDTKLCILTQLNTLFNDNFGLVGLHPCGDLGPLLLRMFNESEDIKFVCIVGCCYMKLTCGDKDALGYPLSAFVSDVKVKSLSYESRELACHALEAYCERLKKGLYQDLQIHCYRALLEKLLVSKWPHLKHSGLKSVKHYNTLTFEKYCDITTKKLGVQLDTTDIHSNDVNKSLKRWKEVVIFYTLRLSLAPLVESVILMDRMLYLRENGATCEMIPLFNPVTSPRNHILIARKP